MEAYLVARAEAERARSLVAAWAGYYVADIRSCSASRRGSLGHLCSLVDAMENADAAQNEAFREAYPMVSM